MRNSVIVYHYENKNRRCKSEKSGGRTVRKVECISKYSTPQKFAKQLRAEGYSVRVELFNDQEVGILNNDENIMKLYRNSQIRIVKEYCED